MTEPYAFIKRAYGLDFSPGQKVSIDVYGGVEGEVIAPLHHRQNYVRVRWSDGSPMDPREGDFHPQEVTVLP